MKTGVLLSGGLDSAALVHHFLKRGDTVWPLYVKCGLPWEKAELYWSRRFLKAAATPRLRPLRILPLSLEGAYKNNWSQRKKFPGLSSSDRAVFLPGRNLLLATKALLSLYPEHVSILALATLRGNPFPDGHPAYFLRLGRLLSESFSRSVQIVTPFRSLGKAEIIRRHAKAPIHLSFSCLNPKGKKHCGRCNKCAERKKAFRKAGVEDKTIYARG